MFSGDPIAELSVEALWDSSVDGLLLVASDGTITATNPSLDSLFRYEPSALVGRPVEDLVPTTLRSAHVAHRQGFEADPRPRPMAARNLEGLRSDGTTFPINISLAPIATAGGAMTFAAVRDLTDRVVHERALTEAHRRRAIAEDHDRIAKELHDSVIQRLFALGIGLQGVPPRIDDPALADRVAGAVDALDEIIADIRGTIYGLREPVGSKQGLRSLVLALAREAEPSLGFIPDVALSGQLDRITDDTLVGHVLAVVREGLSNAGRHAAATAVVVSVAVDGDLTVEISDDGVGIDADNHRRSGLANMESRAAAFGGTFAVVANQPSGTTLRWVVPADQIA